MGNGQCCARDVERFPTMVNEPVEEDKSIQQSLDIINPEKNEPVQVYLQTDKNEKVSLKHDSSHKLTGQSSKQDILGVRNFNQSASHLSEEVFGQKVSFRSIASIKSSRQGEFTNFVTFQAIPSVHQVPSQFSLMQQQFKNEMQQLQQFVQ